MFNNSKFIKQATTSGEKRLLENLFYNEYRTKLKNANESHKHQELKSQLQRQLVFNLIFHQNEIDKVRKDYRKIMLHTGTLDNEKFESIFNTKSNKSIPLNKNMLYDSLLPLKIERVEYERSSICKTKIFPYINRESSVKMINLKFNKSFDQPKSSSSYNQNNRLSKSSLSLSNYDNYSFFDEIIDNENVSFDEIDDRNSNNEYNKNADSKDLNTSNCWSKEHKKAFLKIDKVFSKRYKQLQSSKKLQSPIEFDSNDYHIRLSSRVPRRKIEDDKKKLIESLQRLSFEEAKLEKIKINNQIRLKVKKFLEF